MVLLTQATPFMMLISLLALALPGIFYVYSANVKFSPTWQKAVYFVQQFVFVIGSYLTLLFTFFVPPILVAIASLFFGQLGDLFYRPSASYYGGVYSPPTPEPIIGLLIQIGIGLVIMLLAMGALLVPYLILLVIWRALTKTRVALAEAMSSDQLLTLDAVLVVVILTIGAITAYQPTGNKLLQPLKDLSLKTSFADKETIAKTLGPQKGKLATLIKDKLQSRYRYLFTKDDATLMSVYAYTLHFSDDIAKTIQQTFLTLAYPFVYQGKYRDDDILQTNYQYLFGEYVGQTKTISVSTPIPAKNVLLTYRQVTVTPQASGLVANVTVEEEYDNQTFSQQEVIYEFTLPRGAVMTDLRLGPDLEFVGQIAPKGAAQRTYEQQLQRRRDPALLEETGPRQYRLRVFPIPAKNDFTTLKGRRQKMSFTYAVAATTQGYPLPEITRKTNVYLTAASRLFYVTALGNKPIKESDSYLAFPDNATTNVCGETNPEATNLVLNASQPNLKALACGADREVMAGISGLKIAIFYPVAAANQSSPQLNQLIKTLAENRDVVAKNQVDLYKFNDLLSPKITLNSNNLDKNKLVTFFGTARGLTPLANFQEHCDVVFIYGAKTEVFTTSDALPFAYPTRVFYVNPAAPPFTMKLNSQLLQTGGDTVDTFVDGMRLFLLEKEGSYVLNQYLSFTVMPTAVNQVPVAVAADKSSLTSLTNLAQLSSSLPRFTKDISGDVAILDEINKFAVKANLVSPYSSLIALVNEQQQLTLDQLSQDYNRYQDQQLTQQTQPTPIFSPLNEFQPLKSSSGIFGGLMQPQLMEMDLGGGGSTGVMTNPMMAPSEARFGVSGGGIMSGVSGSSLFVMANVILLVFGLGFYLVRLLRHKS
jgi:hypothetical protein